MKKNNLFTIEMMVAIAATVISLCALTVSVLEVRIMREQQEQARKAQRLSVWPNLQFSQTFNRDGLELMVNNRGVGPAIVKHFEFVFPDTRIETISDSIDHMKDLYPGLDSYDNSFGGIPAGRVLSAGEQHPYLVVPQGAFARHLWDDLVAGEINTSICYCSIYEECWSSTIQTGRVQQVQQCD